MWQFFDLAKLQPIKRRQDLAAVRDTATTPQLTEHSGKTDIVRRSIAELPALRRRQVRRFDDKAGVETHKSASGMVPPNAGVDNKPSDLEHVHIARTLGASDRPSLMPSLNPTPPARLQDILGRPQSSHDCGV
jgi:hypothetical protein